jgi:ribokinase
VSDIVVFGSINRDIVVRVEHLPAPGETIRTTEHAVYPGGKGANQAVAAARCGADVALVGRVGTDGTDLLEAIGGAGVDTTGVAVVDDPTGTALITVASNGDNTIVTTGGANREVGDRELDELERALRVARLLLLQLEVPAAVVEAAIERAEAAGVPVMLDPAPARALSDALLSRLAWITPNEVEARALAGTTSPAWFAERGVRHAVVTLGAAGCAYAGPDGAYEVAAPGVEAVDTVACGDAFSGALAAALVRSEPVAEALRYACAAGAAAARSQGAFASLPNEGEVRRLVDQAYL